MVSERMTEDGRKADGALVSRNDQQAGLELPDRRERMREVSHALVDSAQHACEDTTVLALLQPRSRRRREWDQPLVRCVVRVNPRLDALQLVPHAAEVRERADDGRLAPRHGLEVQRPHDDLTVDLRRAGIADAFRHSPSAPTHLCHFRVLLDDWFQEERDRWMDKELRQSLFN